MRMYVNEIKVKTDGVYCYTEDSIEGMTAAEQMLVDSDNFAFAYVLDDGQAYSYVLFVQETWSMLHENRGKPVIINDTLVLTSFEHELSFLLENIVGNLNYGKEFVAVAEETFELE